MAELREDLTREGVRPAEALRLVEKMEQELRIATRDCRHVTNDTSVE
jgi:hypothetical protein